jgi:hypothetical protein
MSETPAPSPSIADSTLASSQEALRVAQKAQSACLFSYAWLYTVCALVPAVPASIYLRSYMPLLAVSVVGSGADYVRGVSKCRGHAEEVARLEKKVREEKGTIGLSGEAVGG